MSTWTYEERMDGLHSAMRERGIEQHSRAIVMHSLLRGPRLLSIMDAMDRVRGLAGGDTAEIGCSGGGTSILISKLNAGRRHWACDTFTGLVDVGANDDFVNGRFSGDGIVKVRARLTDMQIVQGYFPESAPQEMRDARYVFVHIDVDTYESIRQGFAFFEIRMVPGGIIALDDVIGRGTRGAKKAWMEINSRKEKPWRVVSEVDRQVMVRF